MPRADTIAPLPLDGQTGWALYRLCLVWGVGKIAKECGGSPPTIRRARNWGTLQHSVRAQLSNRVTELVALGWNKGAHVVF